jgi:hypothetical protein
MNAEGEFRRFTVTAMDRPIDGHGKDGVIGEAGERTTPPGNRAHDRHWAAQMRSTIRCTGAFLGLLLLVDAFAGTLTPTRAALWGGLALMLFLILFQPRITAGEGWLAVRGPWAGHRVRTDRLVSVRTTGCAAQRLVLRDSLGGLVELDPRVLIANASLWHRFDTDARSSQRHDCLREGSAVLDHLADRVERETTLAIFKASGLEP